MMHKKRASTKKPTINAVLLRFAESKNKIMSTVKYRYEYLSKHCECGQDVAAKTSSKLCQINKSLIFLPSFDPTWLVNEISSLGFKA